MSGFLRFFGVWREMDFQSLDFVTFGRDYDFLFGCFIVGVCYFSRSVKIAFKTSVSTHDVSSGIIRGAVWVIFEALI